MAALSAVVEPMELIILLLVIALAWALMTRGKARAKAKRREAARQITGDAPVREPEGPTVTGLSFDVDLRYTDRSGEQTERRVTVREAWGTIGPRGGFDLDALISGHCHLRGRPRSFSLRGIEELTDPETGEVISGTKRIDRWLSRRIGAELRAGRGKRAG